jgi:hypothetical protein
LPSRPTFQGAGQAGGVLFIEKSSHMKKLLTIFTRRSLRVETPAMRGAYAGLLKELEQELW